MKQRSSTQCPNPCTKSLLQKQTRTQMTTKRHFPRLGILALVGLLALSETQSVKANLITNGGFEKGDFTGWMQSGNTDFTGVTGTFFDTPPHSGNFQAFFGPFGNPSFITQNLATAPGGSYVLDFWLANLGGPANSFAVLWDGSTIFSLPDLSAFDYTEFTFNVTASSASTALQFEFMHNPSFFLLDDVTVVPSGLNVPDSGSAFSLLGLATLGVAALRRKLSC